MRVLRLRAGFVAAVDGPAGEAARYPPPSQMSTFVDGEEAASPGPAGRRRFVIVASASGCGKTTLGRALADRLGVPFVELDALVHGPGWTEIRDEELRALVQPTLRRDGWVIDGSYSRKLGTLVLDAADTVVWLDLPVRVWLPRLVRRTARRLVRREELWNGNRESLRGVVWGRESLFVWAFRSHLRRRRAYPDALARYDVVRLRTPAEVASWLDRWGTGREAPA